MIPHKKSLMILEVDMNRAIAIMMRRESIRSSSFSALPFEDLQVFDDQKMLFGIISFERLKIVRCC